MTEQELFWNILRSDPMTMCHNMADQLSQIEDKKEFHQKADEYLHQLLNIFQDPEILSRIIKTWLTDYEFPLEPYKLESFNRWDNACRHYVTQHAKNLKTYGVA